MKRCRYCDIKPKEWTQIDHENKTFYVIRCQRCGNSVYSYQSKTNARKKWNKRNEVTIEDLYNAIREVTGFQFLDEKCEEIRKVIRDFEGKI